MYETLSVFVSRIDLDYLNGVGGFRRKVVKVLFIGHSWLVLANNPSRLQHRISRKREIDRLSLFSILSPVK